MIPIFEALNGEREISFSLFSGRQSKVGNHTKLIVHLLDVMINIHALARLFSVRSTQEEQCTCWFRDRGRGELVGADLKAAGDSSRKQYERRASLFL